jgi:hypothetical protein
LATIFFKRKSLTKKGRFKTGPFLLYVESEMHHIPVLDDIFLTLDS